MKSREEAGVDRVRRADAQRSVDALLEAAKAVFATAGVDAPVREIAARAGVGVATIYRHFPQRADLIAAVFRREVDTCAEAARALGQKHEPVDALSRWLHRYMNFIVTKRGLGGALHSGDPAYEGITAYFHERLVPALQSLLAPAVAAGAVRGDIEPVELLRAVGSLATLPASDGGRMVDILVDGLRYRAQRAVDE